MIQENEVVMILIGTSVLIFILFNRLQLKRLPTAQILLGGFYVLVAGWIFTVLEGFFFEKLLNFLEHICYAISAGLVLAWCWIVFVRRGRERQ